MNGEETAKRSRGAVLADDAEKPKKKETSGFDPSVQRSLVSVLKGLEKRLESAAAKPDIKVDVAAPNVKVEAPEVEVSVPKTPRKWKIRITERDDDNRIKEMTIDAVD